jgi:hypothetical protein
MATALALLEKAGLDNHRRTIEHTSVHGLDQELEEQDIIGAEPGVVRILVLIW